MYWTILILAGCFEIGFTTFLKFSAGFTRLWPTVGFAVCAICSFVLLNKATTGIPLGTAYAVWTGIGAAGTALIGILFFGEPSFTGRLFFLGLLIFALVGLKWVSPHA